MSFQRSSRVAVADKPHEGHGGGSSRVRARASVSPTGLAVEGEEGTLGPVPSPLPDDPGVRAELLARLDRGVADALAGRGTDARTVHARLRAKYPLP